MEEVLVVTEVTALPLQHVALCSVFCDVVLCGKTGQSLFIAIIFYNLKNCFTQEGSHVVVDFISVCCVVELQIDV